MPVSLRQLPEGGEHLTSPCATMATRLEHDPLMWSRFGGEAAGADPR